MRIVRLWAVLLILITGFSACTDFEVISGTDEIAQVVHVIDGDTIIVNLNGAEERVRYIGVNTPEVTENEPCADEATLANLNLVSGQRVRMVRDVSNRDRYERLLRYVYVGSTFVNKELIIQGYAEAVRYDPDDAYFDTFKELERQAARANRGCHPTGIFDDGSETR